MAAIGHEHEESDGQGKTIVNRAQNRCVQCCTVQFRGQELGACDAAMVAHAARLELVRVTIDEPRLPLRSYENVARAQVSDDDALVVKCRHAPAEVAGHTEPKCQVGVLVSGGEVAEADQGGEVLGEIRPAATLLVVAGLLKPEMKIEIEVTAKRRSA